MVVKHIQLPKKYLLLLLQVLLLWLHLLQQLRLQFSQVVLRNLLRFVDALPFFYFVGGAAAV